MFEEMSVDLSVRHIHFHGVETTPRKRASETQRPPPRERISIAPVLKPGPKPQSAGSLDPFVGWLLRRHGISADAYRLVPMHRRLPACLRELRVKTPEAARALLENRPELMPVALNAMLLGVSSFFRDTAVFHNLEAAVLPQLLASRNHVRVVGIGVSGGHELYSVAMLFAEAGALQRCSLHGVDCRPAAIKAADHGLFSDSEINSLSAERRNRFFRREKIGWRASVELRLAIDWRIADLFTFHPTRCDLILFRNVAIYLEDDWTTRVWQALSEAVTPGGVLITGKAEKPPGELPLRRMFPSIYQKV